MYVEVNTTIQYKTTLNHLFIQYNN